MMMQGVFSMMHECFHGHGHYNKKVNWFMGWLVSTLFGASFTMSEVYHQGHHDRNRSRPEMGEYIFPDESAIKKTFIYYFAILGGLWLSSFLASILLPFFPLQISRWLSKYKKGNTYSGTFVDFKIRKWNIMRLELLLGVLFWYGVIYFLHWDWRTLAVCYAAFGFSWSSLQWIYHIGTPIHPVEGAYNLRLPGWIRFLFLNFNYNLTHHRNPKIPWYRLYRVSNQDETQPLWYRYLRLFIPPKPLPEGEIIIEKTYF